MPSEMRIEESTGVPEYLDGAFFEDVLENGLHEANVRTHCYTVSLGSNAGDNYCSEIYRAKVKYQRDENSEPERVNVIVKSMPMPDSLSFLVDMKVYHKEKLFYMDILPKLEFLLDDIKLAPRCYFATRKPIYTITFEDMNDQGFTMASRETGLDEHHVRLALKKLAQLHALSMVYAKKEPLLMNQFSFGLLDEKAIVPSSFLYRLLHKYLGYMIEVVSEWKDYEEITEKLREFHNDFQKRLVACQAPRRGELKVFNHGDFWVNNMLYKYVGDQPVDVVLLDFQLSIFGSPGIDLNYFFHASVQMDALKKIDTLLGEYYEEMKNILEQLNFKDIPTYEDIVNEFNQSSAYGLFTLFGPLPVMSMDKSKCGDNSFENLVEGADADEKMVATFSSPRLREHLKYSLKLIDKAGGLDIRQVK